jgi:hypothetical protein
VRKVYEASFGGDADAFRAAMHRDFEEYVPATNVLPQPQLALVVDFASIRLISISADGDHVAALLTAHSTRGDELWAAEHWTLRDDKLWRLRVFYYDTRPSNPRGRCHVDIASREPPALARRGERA